MSDINDKFLKFFLEQNTPPPLPKEYLEKQKAKPKYHSNPAIERWARTRTKDRRAGRLLPRTRRDLEKAKRLRAKKREERRIRNREAKIRNREANVRNSNLKYAASGALGAAAAIGVGTAGYKYYKQKKEKERGTGNVNK